MRKRQIRLISLAMLAALPFVGEAIATSVLPGLAQSTPTRTCAYDSSRGQNPLGMRAFVTATEQAGSTTFRFEQFPSPVGNGAGVTIASRRELTFYDVGVEEARRQLRENRNYYSELVGYEDNEGFAPIDAVLVCQTSSTSGQGNPATPTPTPTPVPTQIPTPTPVPMQIPTPTSGSPRPASRPTIASLPNGAYRYWSGQSSSPIVSDEELLRQGGILFLFRKTGNQITGLFGYIDGEGACIQGTVNGNTVTGLAFPYNQEIENTGERFTSWGPSGALQVRRGRRVGNQARYDSAILNLNGMNRINAGRTLPRSSCP